MTAYWQMLNEHARSATTVVLAAPYLKAAPLMNILRSTKGSIRTFSRWSLQDMVSRVTDLDCRSLVIEKGGRFLLHPRLHAKYYRFDDVVYVGSANFTASGLGYRPDSNLEILCEPASNFDWYGFEEELVSESHDVSDWEFARWKQLLDSEFLSSIAPEPSLNNPVTEWWPHTRDPRHLWLAYTSQLSEIASSDEQILAQRDLRMLGIPLNLPYEHFCLQVAAALLTSRFVVEAFRQSQGADSQAALYALADSWEVVPRTAARRRGTALAWLAYFF